MSILLEEDAARVEVLQDETLRPLAARVAGLLDTVSASRPDVVLRLSDGTRIPGRLEAHDVEALRSLFGKEVVVSGMAHYRPSGRLLLLDVEDLRAARPEDQIFRTAPIARKRKVTIAPGPQEELSGVPAFFGIWPGDESDENLLAALRAIG